MTRLAAILAVLILSACVSAPVADPARLPGGEWRLDASHASVTWQVRHMGLSWRTARFDRSGANLDFDPAAPEAASLTAIVDAASVSTGDPELDAVLRGPGWLDAERHPQISFVSERIEVTGERTGRVHGALTLKGRTAPAILETEFYGGVLNPLEGRQAIGFGADLTVSRSEFSIGRLPPGFLGDEVRLRIEAEFLKED
jgi:polyisoprenoid-binding protein YceI